MGSCKQTNIPTVNEDALSCEDLISTSCIILEQAVSCLQTGKGQTLTKLLERLCVNLNAIQNRLTTVEQDLTEANSAIETLTNQLSLLTERVDDIENNCCE